MSVTQDQFVGKGSENGVIAGLVKSHWTGLQGFERNTSREDFGMMLLYCAAWRWPAGM